MRARGGRGVIKREREREKERVIVANERSRMSGYIYAPGANSPDKAGEPQSALGCACMYCAAASRPKIIYRRIARAARGAASDNSAFRDRDRAGSSPSPPSPFIGLSKLSGSVVCRRERGSEIHVYDKRSLALTSLFVGAASEAGKLFSNRRSRLHIADFNCEILH